MNMDLKGELVLDLWISIPVVRDSMRGYLRHCPRLGDKGDGTFYSELMPR